MAGSLDRGVSLCGLETKVHYYIKNVVGRPFHINIIARQIRLLSVG